MTRSRIVMVVSAGVVALGSAAAIGAWYLDPARAGVGPLPGEGLSLPAQTRFVMGLDLRRFVQSPLYRRAQWNGRPDALGEIEKRTGLNPEQDLDTVVVAGQGEGPRSGALVLVKGGFDRYKVARAIEQEKKAISWKQHEGTTVYLFQEGTRQAGGMAFLSDDAFVLGDLRAVEELLTSRAQGRAPLSGNADLMALLEQVRPGATFWLVGDQSALAHMPRTIPGGLGGSLPLPGLKTVVVTGDLDPLLAVELIGEATDEKAARSLGDVVRGFVALASLQAQSRPELRELAQTVSVTTDGSRVQVSARVPYTLLDALQRPAALSAPAPSAAR